MKQVDDYIAKLPEWQAENLTLLRSLLHDEIADIEEDFKWNVPVFTLGGKVLFAMSAFKAHTKYNFIQNGALLQDDDGLFNNGFESKKSRGIDLKENETINEASLRELIRKSGELARA